MTSGQTGRFPGGVRFLLGMILVSVGAGHRSAAQQSDGGKCRTAWERIDADSMQAGRLRVRSMARPVLDTSIVSPRGHVRVHYDTTGSHAPALTDQNNDRIAGTMHAYADSIARAYDSSWSVLIDDLGFDPPPPDTDGGDDRYDVYILNLPSNQFGETQFAGSPFQVYPNSRYETWILIDNDFTTQRTRGLPGAYVTVAHEFFHAVQIGAYGFWGSSDAYWYELSSTWIEEEVFPGVDDYMYEVSRFMRSFRTTSFAEYSDRFPGYERVLFAQFLSEYFGPSTMRRSWEYLRTEPVIPALRSFFTSMGTSFQSVYSRFALWNYFTADRADPSRFYRKGARYPRLDPVVLTDMAGETASVSYGFSPLSLGLFAVRLDTDTLFVMLTNTDVEAVGDGSVIGDEPIVVLSRGAQALPSQHLALGIRGGLDVRDPSVWDIEYFSSRTGDVAARSSAKPFPNPWDLSLPYDLVLPTSEVQGRNVDIFFLSSDLTAVRLGAFPVGEEKGGTAVRIPSTAVREKIGSGVYVAIVRTEDAEELTKIVIIR